MPHSGVEYVQCWTQLRGTLILSSFQVQGPRRDPRPARSQETPTPTEGSPALPRRGPPADAVRAASPTSGFPLLCAP